VLSVIWLDLEVSGEGIWTEHEQYLLQVDSTSDNHSLPCAQWEPGDRLFTYIHRFKSHHSPLMLVL
jgi:hypothetical protein